MPQPLNLNVMFYFSNHGRPHEKNRITSTGADLITAYTIFSMLQAEQSLFQFGIQLMSSLDTAQVVIDLYILAALACIWMYHDNKSRGKSFASVAPYLLNTAIFVSIGPLLYIVVKGFSKQSSAGKT